MISTIESLKHTLYKTLALPRSSVSIFRSARLYLDVGQTQWDYGLNRAALRAANHGLESLENVEKKGSLCIIYASLFELKATVQWELRESVC